MPHLKFTRLPENDRVTSFNVENTSRNLKAAVHIPRILEGSKHLNTTALINTLSDFTNKSAALLEPHSESGWRMAAPDKLKPIMTETKALQKTAIARSKELEKRKAELLKSDINPEHARELRAWLRTQKPAAAMQKLLKDPQAAMAALENPVGIPGLDDPNLIREIERVAMLHNMAKKYSLEGYDTHRTPSIDDPLAHGVDPERLNSIAKEGLNNFEAALSDVNAVRGVITQAVNYLAVAADMSGHDAFHAAGLDK